MKVDASIDIKKVQKAFGLTEKQLVRLNQRAAKTTARNVRVQASKGNLGIDGLRRKKVPRARVKPLTNGVGVWVGLNPIRSSEFKIRPKQSNGGVTFRGRFYKGYFLARFRYDKNAKSVKRAVRIPTGKKSWSELMVDIEKEAKSFIKSEVEPNIESYYTKNMTQEVDKLRYVKSR